MKITIISVGHIKEKYLSDAIKEYLKRLSKYAKVYEIVIDDEAIPSNASSKNEIEIKNKEGQKILKAMDEKSFKIVLDLKGEMLSSIELASKIDDISTRGASHLSFVIGGSLGLADEVIRQADYRLCFSKMTFPHQLMKVILLEQIYRAFKINNNETYHK